MIRSKARLRAILAIPCALVAATACNSPAKPVAKSSPSPSPTSVPIDSLPQTQTQAWRALEVSVIPPRGYAQQVQLTQEVLNHTGGRVDDATARRWAEAYLRVDQWAHWGTENLQVDGFFNHLAPGDTVTQQAIYGDNYGWMDTAARGNGTLRQTSTTAVRLTLVVVPDGVKNQLTTTYGYPPIPDYALIVDQRGPASVIITYPDGHTTSPASLPSTFRETGFIAGEVKQYPGTLSDIWFAHTYLGCEKNAFLRSTCAS